MLRGQGARLLAGGVGLAAALLVTVMAVAMANGIGGEPLGAASTGFERAAEFELPTLDGSSFALGDHADGPVFVYFWASWCGPCETEAPLIQALWPEYEARGYTFVGVNTWDSERDARAFVERHGLTFPVVVSDGKAPLDYGVYALPEAFFLRPGLEIDRKFLGALTEVDFREALEAIGTS